MPGSLGSNITKPKSSAYGRIMTAINTAIPSHSPSAMIVPSIRFTRADVTIFDRFAALRMRQIMAYVCSAGRTQKVQTVAALANKASRENGSRRELPFYLRHRTMSLLARNGLNSERPARQLCGVKQPRGS